MTLLLVACLALGPTAGEGWEVDADRGAQVDLRLEATAGTWTSVDVSPDGRTLCFDLLGHLYELPVEGGEAYPITRGKSWNAFPRYSPDGDFLAFTSDRGGSFDLWVLDRRDGTLANASAMELPVFQGTWSRDGRFLYGTALDLRALFPAFRFNARHGTRVELLPAGERKPPTHFDEHPDGRRVFFERFDRPVYTTGPRIDVLDLETGAVAPYLDRPGGACNPRLSPDGAHLVYVHRDDLDTVLVLHELGSRAERVLARGLDRGRFDNTLMYGVYPNVAWHPDGRSVFYTAGGAILRVGLDGGEPERVPYRAPVRRRLDATLRFPVEVPRETARTRSHRFGLRVAPDAVLFEALGDLWLRRGDELENLTASGGHETAPALSADGRTLAYAVWSDAQLGAVVTRAYDPATGRVGPPRRVTTTPSQYGAVAFGTPRNPLAFVRGAGDVRSGTRIEEQTAFELVTLDAAGRERVVTDVEWLDNEYAHRPPFVQVAPGDGSDAVPDGAAADESHGAAGGGPDAAAGRARGDWLYFTEYVGDALTLKRVRDDGLGEQVLYSFPRATCAVLSPDRRWIAFREDHRSYVAPFEFAGRAITLSPADGIGPAWRVGDEDGEFLQWSPDAATLRWTRGLHYLEQDLDGILAGTGSPRRTALDFEFDVARPAGAVLLRGARVLTMDAENRVLEGADVLVEGDRIAAVGPDLAPPPGARVLELAGHTVMPGLLDAHGHYGSDLSTLYAIEQRPWGLACNLAHGVTTMVEVYGKTHKDLWLGDMIRAGKVDGPRVFSSGDPVFVTRYRKKMYRPLDSYADALEVARFNADHGARCLKDYSNHRRAARQQLAAACRELGLNLVTESFADPLMNLSQVVDGFTGIEHTMGITPLQDDVVQLLAASEVGMTPTLIVLYGGPPGERWFHQRERVWEDEKLLRFHRRDELLRMRRPTTHHFEDDFHHPEAVAELRKLHDAGVLLTMGAHGQRQGLGAHWEIELFVQGGFTPAEALRIATWNGCRHHGLDADLGSLEVGKLADLVVLSANPLEDVRNTRAVELVMRNGFLHAGADGARVWPDPAPSPELYFKRGEAPGPR